MKIVKFGNKHLLKNIHDDKTRSAIINFLEILHGLSSNIDKNLLEISALTSTSLMNNFYKRKKYGNNL